MKAALLGFGTGLAISLFVAPILSKVGLIVYGLCALNFIVGEFV